MDKRLRNSNIALLQHKQALKADVDRVTTEAFNSLDNVLHELVADYNAHLEPSQQFAIERMSDRILKLIVGDDTLIFARHTNIFRFDRDHAVWQKEYVTQDPDRAYAGIINVYDFLSASFRFDRDEDIGYLIARVFVNKDNTFFVEGKRQRGMGVDHFGTRQVDADNLRRIVETAVKYAAEFDLLVSPYDSVKLTDLAHMKLEIMASKVKTGKRLGFRFNSDDVL